MVPRGQTPSPRRHLVDLMSALKAAVEQTRADRQRGKGHPEPKAAPARRAGPRKRRAGPTPDRAS